jgi:hypothetical protein
MLIIFTGIVAFILMEDGVKYRKEVLSMDTKSNLYENHQKYRKFLNEIFYYDKSD